MLRKALFVPLVMDSVALEHVHGDCRCFPVNGLSMMKSDGVSAEACPEVQRNAAADMGRLPEIMP